VERNQIAEAEPVVVLEDGDFVVAAKPAGMNTAPLRRGEGGTLLAWILERYPEVASLPGLKAVEPGLLHRLDRDTSGLVLVARTAAAWEGLRTAARDGRFLKRYRALVSPHDRPPPGTRALLAPLGPRLAESGGDALPPLPLEVASAFRAWGPGRRRVAAVAAGAAAGARLYRTRLLALERDRGVPGESGGGTFFRVLVEIETGFRHQVRVHLASAGLPIVGDALYGPPDQPAAARLYLHACALEFPHPVTGRPVVVAHESF
jgi:23S rRNA pseudouridine1911/1915/1917 synthase